TGDGLSKVPEYWDEKDLFNILYASMPLFLPPDQNYWNANRERFISSANLVSAVFRNCGFAKMTDHQFLSSDRKVQKSDYDNSWSVCANFSNSDFSFMNEILPSKGFYATNGEEFVFRKKYQGNTIAVTFLKDRIFINPMGKDITFSGIRSYGSTLIKKYDNYLVVSFIGDQNFVDININEIPWKMKNVKLEGLTNNVQYNYTLLDNSWIRIPKKDNQRFYKITADFNSDVIDDKPLSISYSLEQNYPNPFNPTTSINYSIPKGGNVRLEIYDSLGEIVNIVKDSYDNAGNYTITWTGKDSNGNSLASGIYFYRLVTNGFTQVRKMILLK
ncbi:MAG: T9SS type A sorting domain-containing protein, partial [Melioribacteraceae bacterium]